MEFFLGETCARKPRNHQHLGGAGPGYPFPIFVVAFAPQRHNKGFASPVRKSSGPVLSLSRGEGFDWNFYKLQKLEVYVGLRHKT